MRGGRGERLGGVAAGCGLGRQAAQQACRATRAARPATHVPTRLPFASRCPTHRRSTKLLSKPRAQWDPTDRNSSTKLDAMLDRMLTSNTSTPHRSPAALIDAAALHERVHAGSGKPALTARPAFACTLCRVALGRLHPRSRRPL